MTKHRQLDPPALLELLDTANATVIPYQHVEMQLWLSVTCDPCTTFDLADTVQALLRGWDYV